MDLMESKVDIVLRLRELRRISGLSQREVALLSGLGEKTISSFETGTRTDAMKVGQLRQLLAVYGVSEAEFFSDEFDDILLDEDAFLSSSSVLRGLVDLPSAIRAGLLEKISLMVETAHHVHALEASLMLPPQPGDHDWEMLNSRN